MSTSNNKTTDEARIRGLIENWAKAVRAKDIDGIMANHAPDILLFDVPSPVQWRGAEAYRKSWETFFPWFQNSGVFELSELRTMRQNPSGAI
jgi:ketosteroid isomerase-like protein